MNMIDNKNKPKMVIAAPIATLSGYGQRSRDLIYQIIKLDKFDVTIIPTRWGNTPMLGLKAADERHKLLVDHLAQGPITEQPDIWVQVTVPNEFQPMGKYNIGITAGMETTAISSDWIEGCNRMDIILVSSNHSKDVFLETIYDKIESNTNQKMGVLSVVRPVFVLPEGIDVDIFKSIPQSEIDLPRIDTIPESFCFLTVGHWLQGELGHDRKDIGGTIKTFCEAFAGQKDMPALIVKTGATYSYVEMQTIEDRISAIRGMIKNCPNVYLLSGEMSQSEMVQLYNHDKIKAMLSFTKGEGFGRPLLEFALTGKPIICPEWSGQSDFFDKLFHIPLPGELKQVHPSAVWEGVIISTSGWFNVNYEEAGKILQNVYKKYTTYKSQSLKSVTTLRRNFSDKKMFEILEKIFDDNVPMKAAPKFLGLNIPNIKKREKVLENETI